ncbi:hypothetical protein HZS_8037, partial [Henneguya salminicola]
MAYLHVSAFLAEIYDLLNYARTDTIKLSLVNPFIKCKNMYDMHLYLKYLLQKYYQKNNQYNLFYKELTKFAHDFNSICRSIHISTAEISNSYVDLQNMWCQAIHQSQNTNALIQKLSRSTQNTHKCNETVISTQKNIESYKIQIKRLKSLLIAAKNHNDLLTRKISAQELNTSEFEKLQKCAENETIIAHEFAAFKQEHENFVKECEKSQINNEYIVQKLKHTLEFTKKDLYLSTLKNSILQKEYDDYKLKKKVKNKHIPDTVEILAEKQRNMLNMQEINTQYVLSTEKIKTLENVINDIKQKNSKLELLNSDLEAKIRNEQENKIQCALIIQSLNDKISGMKKPIETTKPEADVIDYELTPSQQVVSHDIAEQKSAIEKELQIDKPSTRNSLELILKNVENTNEPFNEDIFNENIVDKLIDTENENCLLRNQVGVLKEEIRRLDSMREIFKENGDFESLTAALTGVIVQTLDIVGLLPKVLEILQPNRMDSQKLRLFAQTSSQEAESTLSNIVGY